MKTKIDSVIANVYDLDRVLLTLKEELNLTPFFKDTINLQEQGQVRMALVSLKNCDLEFIECAKIPHPMGMSQITHITIEHPAISEETVLALEEDLPLHITHGKQPRLTCIQTDSTTPEKDASLLLNCCNESRVDRLPDDGRAFSLNEIAIHFLHKPTSSEELPAPEDLSSIHGWRRVAFGVKHIEKAVTILEKAGAETVVPIFQVMPGLREAMLCLPSGIVIQPVEQKVLKMMPLFLWKQITQPKEKINAKA